MPSSSQIPLTHASAEARCPGELRAIRLGDQLGDPGSTTTGQAAARLERIDGSTAPSWPGAHPLIGRDLIRRQLPLAEHDRLG